MENLADTRWRLENLYWIIDDDAKELPFRPNAEQAQFLDGMWFYNLILKARQLGFTTLMAIFGLDQAMWVPNYRVVMIAETEEKAKKIFDQKVVYAWEKLPQWIKDINPLVRKTASRLEFSNGAFIEVTVSARSGTCDLLHISEFGKICAKQPEKAREIVTGSINAVPVGGTVVIESTAEGNAGYFYDYCQEAKRLSDAGKMPNKQQYRLHFFPWFTKVSYSIEDPDFAFYDDEKQYFGFLEGLGIKLTHGQKVFRAQKGRTQSADVYREFPATPEEAFMARIKGAILGESMTLLRKMGHLTHVPFERSVPVNTFWDLGTSTGNQMCVWFHQVVGQQHRFIRYWQKEGTNYSTAAKEVASLKERLGFVYGKHHLPHDAWARKMGDEQPSARDLLVQHGLEASLIVEVPRITDKTVGINHLQNRLPDVWIDQDECIDGVKCLDHYRYKYNENTGAYSSEPAHDWASNGSDAAMQWAQWYFVRPATTEKPRRHRESMLG